MLVSTKNRFDGLNQAVEQLKSGHAVAIPTETVYGLAADATNGVAVARIFQLKDRPKFNPLICHVDGLVMADQHGMICELAQRLANAFWPGPLTLVVKKKPESPVHDLVTAGLDTIGLRCPRGLARQIISAFGRPLAAPSANRSGNVSPTRAEHVEDDFSKEDLVIVDGGPCSIGLESTIVRLMGDKVFLLRPGAISAEEIFEKTEISVQPLEAISGSKTAIQAPGMLKSHYAPNAEVILNQTDCGPEEAWLGFGNDPEPENAKAVRNLSIESNLVEAAANLYAFMKELDATGAKRICVARVPMEEIGIAINDRLKRAAAPRDQEL